MKFLLLLIPFLAFSQEHVVKGFVLDSQNKAPIAYVNISVIKSQIGTSSDTDGSYSLLIKEQDLSKNIKLSSLGYKDSIITVSRFLKLNKILLQPIREELDEVVISHKYENRIFKIQPYSKKDLYGGFGISKKPWQIGLYFPYDSAYYKTEYIQKIAILLNKGLGYKRKVSKFRVRLFSVTQDSLPDKDLIKENIIVTALKKQKEVNINLAAYNIVFPKNGVYVMFEGLAIPFNEVERSYTMTGIDGKKSKVKKETAYVPNFKAFLGESGKFLVVHYSDGKWFKFPVPHDKGKKYFVPAISLTLSN